MMKTQQRTRHQVEELDPRILYSADASALFNPQAITAMAEVRLMDYAPPAAAALSAQVSSVAHEIAFVDTCVVGYQTLVDDLLSQAGSGRSIDVVLIDGHSSGIDQITAALKNHGPVDAIHIFSEGNDGSLQLGDTRLNALTLAQNQASIAAWGQALNAGGDLLIYGCDLAASAAGQSLVNSLSALTHAAVAASIDATGNAALRGNWVLEYQTGAIHVPVAIDAAGQAAFQGLLVNNAPTTGTVLMTAIPLSEDVTSGAVLVNNVLAAASWADVDAGALKGIAVTFASGNGTWQYSTDGATWVNFGAVSATNALLLTSSSLVHYIPDGKNGESVSMGFRAWDQTTDTASTNATPSYANPGAGGGSTAYSTVTVSPLNFGVYSLNDAPTISSGAVVPLSATSEDATSTATLASIILAGAGWADVDTGALSGMAITGVSGNGTWQYSTDGTVWTAFGAVSSSNALLVTATTQVRYVPDGMNGEAASFSLRAWDRTSGTASTNATPAYANPGPGGGTSAYSIQSASASMTVTSVNDAPTGLGNLTLAPVVQNAAAPAGAAINTLAGLNFSDVDSGATLVGVAVVGNSANALTQGVWQYCTNPDATWYAIGSVANDSALVLSATTLVRFVPAAHFIGVPPPLTVRALDNSYASGYSSSAGAEVRLTISTLINGGTTAISANTNTLGTRINDAPTITDASTVALPGTDENTTSGTMPVASILASAGWADVDSGALSGMAITSVTASGTWQYSTDGVTWSAFGAVSASNALLLSSTSQLRYVPDNMNGETASFTFAAWDQTSGSASTNATPSYANAGVAGGASAYSSQSASATMVVGAVNDAPSVNAVYAIPSVNEDAGANSGTYISLLASGVSDVDAGALKGLAITGLDNTHGNWQYTLDGTNWVDIGNVSPASARLLPSDATTKIRFVPNADWNGSTGQLYFEAWDQTSGSAGALADVSAGGGTTAFSSGTYGSSIYVLPVNDAPTALGASSTLAAVAEDAVNPAGATVSSLFGGLFSDATDQVAGGSSVNAFAGVAVVGNSANPASEGVWQWFDVTALSWNNVSVSASTSAALQLDSGTLLRFLPNANFNGTPGALTVRLIDDSAGSMVSSATVVNIGVGGGTTRYSSAGNAVVLGTSITAVNDAPTLTDGATAVLPTTNEDTTSSATLVSSILALNNWADVDASALSGIAVTLVTGQGTWQYSTDGATWSNFGAVSISHSLLLTSTTQLRYVPDGKNAETAHCYFVAWDQTSASASTSATPSYANSAAGGGANAYSLQSAGASIAVTSVNDAPVISGLGLTGPATDENTNTLAFSVNQLLADDAWVDVDLGALKGLVVMGATGTGSWQYSTDGVTWAGVGAVSATNALLLDAASQLRYVPDGKNGEVAMLSFKAWDQTTGLASSNATPAYANPGMGGGASAYSLETTGVSITVTSLNDAPTLANGATVVLAGTDENTTSSATLVSSVLTSASWADADTGALSGVAITGITGNGSWKYSTDGVSWSAFGAVSAGNALLLSATTRVQYVPDGLNGETATFSFQAWDQSSASASTNAAPAYANPVAAGGISAYSSQSASVSIAVTSLNDAPTVSGAVAGQAVGDNATISPFATFTVADVDLPVQTLAVSVALDTAAKGSFTTLNGFANAGGVYTFSGTAAAAQSAIRGLVFTPTANRVAPGLTESTSFTVSVSDGIAAAVRSSTASVVSTSINDAPTLAAPAAATYVDTAAPDRFSNTSGSLAGNDIDVGSTLSYGVAGGTVSGGVSSLAATYGTLAVTTASGAYTYSPNAAAIDALTTNQSDRFSVTVSDGALGATASYSVNLIGSNDAALLSAAVVNLTQTNAPLTAAGTLSISDADSPATFLAQASTPGAYGSLSIDATGAWSYSASSAHNEFVAGQTYTDVFSVASADGTTSSVTVNILGTNDAAVLSADVANLVETSVPLSASGKLTISDVDSPQVFIPSASVIGNGDSFSVDATGAWSFVAGSAHSELLAGQTYTDMFAVSSVDGTSTSVTVHILGTDPVPVANSDSFSGNENESVAGNVLANDVSGNGNRLVAGLVSGPTHGSLSLNADGSFSYAPAANWNGSDSFTYVASDGSASSSLASVSLLVNPVNTPPTSSAVTLAPIAENSGARLITQGELLASAVDVDGPALVAKTLSISSGAGSLVDNADGSWSFVPALNSIAPVSFSYVVSDGSLSAAGTATMSITPAIAVLPAPVEPPASPTSPTPPAAAVPVAPPAAPSQPSAPASTAPGAKAPEPALQAPAPTLPQGFVFDKAPPSAPSGNEAATPVAAATSGDASLSLRLPGASDVREMLRFLPLKAALVVDLGAWTADLSMASQARPAGGFSAITTKLNDAEPIKGTASLELGEVDATHIVGIVLTAGFATWAVSASGLMAALLVSVPAWRNLDPLPILAPEEDRPDWDVDEAQDLEEAAMSGLWRLPAGYGMEEDAP